jgi:mycothiol synthase
VAREEKRGCAQDTLRLVTEIQVLTAFAPADIDAIAHLAADIEAGSGVVPFGDDAWTGIHQDPPGRDRGLLVHASPSHGEDSPRADAYAHLAHHHAGEWALELAVRPGSPDVRTELLTRALELVAAAGGGHVTFWAHGAEPADDELAAAAGFVPERELQQLRVPLPLADPPHWPDGVTVRTFVAGRDEEGWVAVNNRAFAGHVEQGDWTVETLLLREAEPWFDPEGFLLAFDDEGLAGFCWTKVHAPQPPAEPLALGEIYVIGADPARHGKGLGRALTTAGLESLSARGITVGMLFVDGANAAAVGLYRKLGFIVHRVDRAFGRTVAPTSR